MGAEILNAKPTAQAGRRKEGETINAFAQRRYEAQRRYFKAAGINVPRWKDLPSDVRWHWFLSTTYDANSELAIARRQAYGNPPQHA
jgi:hypothetical protein